MPATLARSAMQRQFGYVPHTSVGGDAWQHVRKGTATGAGAAGGTTLIDADVGGSDDDWNGRWYIEIKSGTNKGLWKRIVDYATATGTFTLENNGFPNQVASGVEYAIWLSPEPVVLVDSSSGETDMVDAVRADGDDFWNGYYACPITGTHRGKTAQITDFTSGTGTFVLAASFGSALTAGDVVLIRKFVEVDGDPGNTQGYIPRSSPRVNLSKGYGVVGARTGSFSFSTQIRPSGTLAGDTVLANKATLSGLFQAVGLVESVGTTTKMDDAGASSTTTSLKIDTATGNENFALGAMIIVNGEATFVDAITDGGGSADTLTVSPALSVVPGDNDVVYATTMYRKSTDLDLYGVTLEMERDGVRETMTGCKGNVTLTDGETMTLAWEFQVDHWIREIEAAPYNAGTAYSTTAPVLSTDRLAYLDATRTDIKGFTATPGTQLAAKKVQGNFGINGQSAFQFSDYAEGGTWRELLDSSGTLPQELRFLAGTSSKLAVVFGTHAGTFAVRIPAAIPIETAGVENADGMLEVPNVFGGHDAGVADDGSGTNAKIPDFAFYLA